MKKTIGFKNLFLNSKTKRDQRDFVQSTRWIQGNLSSCFVNKQSLVASFSLAYQSYTLNSEKLLLQTVGSFTTSATFLSVGQKSCTQNQYFGLRGVGTSLKKGLNPQINSEYVNFTKKTWLNNGIVSVKSNRLKSKTPCSSFRLEGPSDPSTYLNHLQQKEEESKSKKEFLKYFNQCFDKNRIKIFVLWFLVNYGENKTIELVEQLKHIGFQYASKAGISLGIDDLKIPAKKAQLIYDAEKKINGTIHQYVRGEITGVERFQRLIDTWHRISDVLKQEVINNFESTDILNPVYMMAFSGARGNISQVRQLVGMRGLMSDPQGQIIDFPIRSNFREGLTLTEYIISSYGARKGIVDTALRTANAGYLTRRLVDVAQHVVISKFDCGTHRGIFLINMKEGNKIIHSLSQRIVGRILARDLYITDTSNQGLNESFIDSRNNHTLEGIETSSEGRSVGLKKINLATRNEEVSFDLAFEIGKQFSKVFVRSPLTCETPKCVCQLCYGWSLAQGNLVSIGEAVGVVAAQSIGEPGTQLTMRTFHTGGVFSGDISDQIRAPFNGIVEYISAIPGLLIRTPEGQIAFLTKGEGSFRVHKSTHQGLDNNPSRTEFNQPSLKKFKIPHFTLLYIRNGQSVTEKEVIAQITTISRKGNATDDAEFTIKSEYEGEFYSKSLYFREKQIGPKMKKDKIQKNQERLASFQFDNLYEAWTWGYAWILSGQIYESIYTTPLFAKRGDFFNTESLISQTTWNLHFNKGHESTSHFRVSSPSFLKNLPGLTNPKNLYGPASQIIKSKDFESSFNIFQNQQTTLSFNVDKIHYKTYGYIFQLQRKMPFFAKNATPFKTSNWLVDPKDRQQSSLANWYDKVLEVPTFFQSWGEQKTVCPPKKDLFFSIKSFETLKNKNDKKRYETGIQWFIHKFQTKTAGILFDVNSNKTNTFLNDNKMKFSTCSLSDVFLSKEEDISFYPFFEMSNNQTISSKNFQKTPFFKMFNTRERETFSFSQNTMAAFLSLLHKKPHMNHQLAFDSKKDLLINPFEESTQRQAPSYTTYNEVKLNYLFKSNSYSKINIKTENSLSHFLWIPLNVIRTQHGQKDKNSHKKIISLFRLTKEPLIIQMNRQGFYKPLSFLKNTALQTNNNFDGLNIHKTGFSLEPNRSLKKDAFDIQQNGPLVPSSTLFKIQYFSKNKKRKGRTLSDFENVKKRTFTSKQPPCSFSERKRKGLRAYLKNPSKAQLVLENKKENFSSHMKAFDFTSQAESEKQFCTGLPKQKPIKLGSSSSNGTSIGQKKEVISKGPPQRGVEKEDSSQVKKTFCQKYNYYRKNHFINFYSFCKTFSFLKETPLSVQNFNLRSNLNRLFHQYSLLTKKQKFNLFFYFWNLDLKNTLLNSKKQRGNKNIKRGVFSKLTKRIFICLLVSNFLRKQYRIKTSIKNSEKQKVYISRFLTKTFFKSFLNFENKKMTSSNHIQVLCPFLKNQRTLCFGQVKRIQFSENSSFANGYNTSIEIAPHLSNTNPLKSQKRNSEPTRFRLGWNISSSELKDVSLHKQHHPLKPIKTSENIMKIHKKSLLIKEKQVSLKENTCSKRETLETTWSMTSHLFGTMKKGWIFINTGDPLTEELSIPSTLIHKEKIFSSSLGIRSQVMDLRRKEHRPDEQKVSIKRSNPFVREKQVISKNWLLHQKHISSGQMLTSNMVLTVPISVFVECLLLSEVYCFENEQEYFYHEDFNVSLSQINKTNKNKKTGVTHLDQNNQEDIFRNNSFKLGSFKKRTSNVKKRVSYKPVWFLKNTKSRYYFQNCIDTERTTTNKEGIIKPQQKRNFVLEGPTTSQSEKFGTSGMQSRPLTSRSLFSVRDIKSGETNWINGSEALLGNQDLKKEGIRIGFMIQPVEDVYLMSNALLKQHIDEQKSTTFQNRIQTQTPINGNRIPTLTGFKLIRSLWGTNLAKTISSLGSLSQKNTKFHKYIVNQSFSSISYWKKNQHHFFNKQHKTKQPLAKFPKSDFSILSLFENSIENKTNFSMEQMFEQRKIFSPNLPLRRGSHEFSTFKNSFKFNASKVSTKDPFSERSTSLKEPSSPKEHPFMEVMGKRPIDGKRVRKSFKSNAFEPVLTYKESLARLMKGKTFTWLGKDFFVTRKPLNFGSLLINIKSEKTMDLFFGGYKTESYMFSYEPLSYFDSVIYPFLSQNISYLLRHYLEKTQREKRREKRLIFLKPRALSFLKNQKPNLFSQKWSELIPHLFESPCFSLFFQYRLNFNSISTLPTFSTVSKVNLKGLSNTTYNEVIRRDYSYSIGKKTYRSLDTSLESISQLSKKKPFSTTTFFYDSLKRFKITSSQNQTNNSLTNAAKTVFYSPFKGEIVSYASQSLTFEKDNFQKNEEKKEKHLYRKLDSSCMFLTKKDITSYYFQYPYNVDQGLNAGPTGTNPPLDFLTAELHGSFGSMGADGLTINSDEVSRGKKELDLLSRGLPLTPFGGYEAKRPHRARATPVGPVGGVRERAVGPSKGEASSFKSTAFEPTVFLSKELNNSKYQIQDIIVNFVNMTDIRLVLSKSPKDSIISESDKNQLILKSTTHSLTPIGDNLVKAESVSGKLDRDVSLNHNKGIQVSNLIAGTPFFNKLSLIGDFMVYGDPLSQGYFFKKEEKNLLQKSSYFEKWETPVIKTSGHIIHYNKSKITLRRSQPIFISPKAILRKFDGDFIEPKAPVITLSYQRLKTGDIIQGIPKVEQYFEARTTKRNRLFRDSIPSLLKGLFQRYQAKLPFDLAVRQSFYKIQQIVVDGVQRVYKSQGVTISDKHLEVIVRQMTSKVRVLDGAQTGFFPGEILDLSFVEKVNHYLIKKITYEPLILGITKASLEVDSFLSAASFQQTTRVLSKAAIYRKKDFLKGLKENVILGNLIPAGTGYLVYLEDLSK